jgi:hypothetical protein
VPIGKALLDFRMVITPSSSGKTVLDLEAESATTFFRNVGRYPNDKT